MDNQFSLDQIRAVLKQVVDEASHLTDYEKQVLKSQVDRMSEETLKGVAKTALESKKPASTTESNAEPKNLKAAMAIQKIVANLIESNIPEEVQFEVVKNFLDNQEQILS